MRNRTGQCRLEEAFRQELFRLINQYLSFPEDATLVSAAFSVPFSLGTITTPVLSAMYRFPAPSSASDVGALNWLTSRRALDFAMRDAGLTIAEVMAEKPWPTLGKYVSDLQSGGVRTPHQQFLRTFTYGFWREYSAIAHSGFEGLMIVGMYYVPDSFIHEDREKLEAQHIGVLSLHVPRAALILLCIVTELQAYFRFEGADINKRIHAMWNALMPLFDAKELYDERYRQLMIDKNIEDW